MIHPSHRQESRSALPWVVAMVVILGWSAFLPVPAVSRGPASHVPLQLFLAVAAMAVAAMVFGIAWTSQRYRPAGRVLLLGVGLLGAALLDAAHTLSLQGMPGFVTPSGTEKAIDFWLAARALAMLALLLVAWLPTRFDAALNRLPRHGLLSLVLVLVALTYGWFLGYPQRVPRTFVQELGTTHFRLFCEYVLVLGNLLACLGFALLLRGPREFNVSHLMAATLIVAMSEFFFTLRDDAGGLYLMLGHAYKIVAYGFLYRALFVETVQRPFQELLNSQASLKATLDALPDLLFEVGRDGGFVAVHANQAGKMAVPAHTVPGRTIRELLPPEVVAQCLAAIEEAAIAGTSHGRRISLQVPEGFRHFDLSVARKRQPPGQQDSFLFLSRDITDMVDKAQLVAREAQLNAGLLALQDQVGEEDEQLSLRRAVALAQQLTGSGAAFIHFVEDDQAGLMLAAAAPAADEGSAAPDPLRAAGACAEAMSRRDTVVWNRAERPHRLLCVPVLEGGGVRLLLGVCEKSTDYRPQDVEALRVLSHAVWSLVKRRRQEMVIHRLARNDQLTGLINKPTFEERLHQSLSQAAQDRSLASLLWFNLDNFKAVNDSLGHAAGDQVLVEMTRRLRAALGEQATLGRHTGDSFVAIVPELAQDAVARVAQHALDQVQALARVGQSVLSLSASAGIAIYPQDGDSAAELVKAAEMAMYRVKQEGRNGLRFYAPEMRQHGERALALSAALKQAIAQGELSLVYQPQLRIADGALVGAEALLRWHHPVWGAVSPGEFIPLAEQSGQIAQIGWWVLEQAASQVRRWRQAQGPLHGLPVAVNVSAIQLVQPDFVESVRRLVERLQVPASSIEFELTEAVALRSLAVGHRLEALSAAGFKVAIDDFGTGYSSMSYLKRFAVDKLKIDQSFIRELSTDADDQAIVTAIVQMAHSLGLSAEAEGVETEAQLAFLRARGCDVIQGYWYSRPLDAQALESFAQARA